MATSYVKQSHRFKMATGNVAIRSWVYVGGTELYALGPVSYAARDRSVDNASFSMSSNSTKPWGPSGKPTTWTGHQKILMELVGDWAQSKYYEPKPTDVKVKGLTRDYSGSAMSLLGYDLSTGMMVFPELPSDAELHNKLLGKLKSEFNAAVALAEANKAVDLIAQNAKRIAKAFDFVVQGKRRAAMEVLNLARLRGLGPATKDNLRRRHRNRREREIASDWLQMQYGWLPLVNDVYNAVEHARNRPSNPLVRVGSRRNHFQTKRQTAVPLPFGLGYCAYVRTSQGHATRRITLEYQIDNTYVQRLSSVSLTNPLIVGWELLPFSFVVDWFLPIGSWLNGLDATLGLQFVRMADVRTYVIEQTDLLETEKDGGPTPTAGSIVRRSYHKDRFLASSFPTPKFPHLKNPLSVTHATNALALLTSAFSKVR